jgi:hypothetical protein
MNGSGLGRRKRLGPLREEPRVSPRVEKNAILCTITRWEQQQTCDIEMLYYYCPNYARLLRRITTSISDPYIKAHALKGPLMTKELVLGLI